MKPLIPTVALAALVQLAGGVEAKQDAPVLVGLFTSQGCNSCPAADAVLAELTEHTDILPLAFHVTYWDRLGWKDIFGDERFTTRQRDYARLLGASSVYTPQAVVAGEVDVVGSSRGRLTRAIETVREHGEAVPLTIGDDGQVGLPATLATEGGVLWAAAWDDCHSVAVERGENAGRTLDYHHVVRWLESWGEVTEAPVLPLAELRTAGRAGVAVVLLRRSDGRVLAVGRRDL